MYLYGNEYCQSFTVPGKLLPIPSEEKISSHADDKIPEEKSVDFFFRIKDLIIKNEYAL